jgi:hypothetical protein
MAFCHSFSLKVTILHAQSLYRTAITRGHDRRRVSKPSFAMYRDFLLLSNGEKLTVPVISRGA